MGQSATRRGDRSPHAACIATRRYAISQYPAPGIKRPSTQRRALCNRCQYAPIRRSRATCSTSRGDASVVGSRADGAMQGLLACAVRPQPCATTCCSASDTAHACALHAFRTGFYARFAPLVNESPSKDAFLCCFIVCLLAARSSCPTFRVADWVGRPNTTNEYGTNTSWQKPPLRRLPPKRQ